MDVREKLVEILKQAPFEGKVLDEWWWEEKIKRIADHLISNGVTVQEWISVDDRLPKPFVSVLVQMPGEKPFPTVHEGFISNNGIWQSEMFRREPGEVTHWMQMPKLPKGE